MGYRMPFQAQDIQLRTPDQGMYDTMQGDQSADALNASMVNEQGVPSQIPQAPGIQGPQAAQEITTETSIPSPKMERATADYMGAVERQKLALAQAGTKEAEAGAAQAKMYEDMATENKRVADEQVQRQQALKTALDAKDNQINTAKAEFQASKIDGMRIFRDNNQNKVIAVLGLALGGMGAALTGGKNYAADMLNTVIENDINEQKYEASKKGASYDMAIKERDLLEKNFNTEDDRHNAAKLMRYEGIKLKAEGMMARANNEKQQQQMAQTIATIDQNVAQIKMQMYQSEATKVKTTTAVTGAAAGGLSQAQRGAAAKENVEWSNMLTSVMDAYDKAGSIKLFEGIAPQAIPGSKKAEIRAQQAGIAAQLIGRVPGLRSEQDYKQIIVPLLPEATDREETIKAKRAAFTNFLSSQAPSGYLTANKPYAPASAVKVSR